jgi:Ala-tRNA(Pro) deacylase
MTTCAERLHDYMQERGVPFTSHSHPEAFTALEIAELEHVSGKQMAKVVMAMVDGQLTMLVLPAPARVDLDLARAVFDAGELRLANEEEFAPHFPDCDVGAMPPFGNLYNLPTYVDRSLTQDEQIVFQAGTHRETMTMRYADYADLVQPIVATFH